MKISLVTVVFNAEKTIQASLRSSWEQENPFYEHIILDGKSSDSTVRLIEEMFIEKGPKPRIIFESEADEGLYDALNKAVFRATGDYIIILHSDDRFSDKRVTQKISKSLEENSFPDVLIGGLRYMRENGTVQRVWRPYRERLRYLFLGWMAPHPAMVVSRSLCQSKPYTKEFRISSDYDYQWRVFGSKPKVKFLDEMIIDMAVGGVSNAGLKNLILKMKEDLIISYKYVGLFCIITILFKNFRKIPQFFR